MSARIQRAVAHYAKDDPRKKVGGVATFARNLELIFDRVVFMTRTSRDFEWAARERVPIICDNHWVKDVPTSMPAIGFQHGVAAEKFRLTRSLTDLKLSLLQRSAAKRPNTLWVACAEWIARAFEHRHGNGARHVIYHHVDLQRFDGELDNEHSRLVLHDARNEHKGSRQMASLLRALPDFDFEPLNCAPQEVPDRMRRALAFIHLSRYEGNSIVCNEAMAQSLPCLFTRVGLFRDALAPQSVEVLDPNRAFDDEHWLVERVSSFLAGAKAGSFSARAWVEQHASVDVNREAWQKVLNELDAMQPTSVASG